VSNALDINGYQFTEKDALLLDTNVLYFVYGPHPSSADAITAVYSGALRHMLEAHCALFVDVLILSEFINSYSRYHYNAAHYPGDFKEYRRSEAFEPVADEIADRCKHILKDCHRTDTGFESANIHAILDIFALECPDFNDQMLAEICRRKDFKLVTHDGDFEGCDVTVLTANRRLLGV